MREIDPETNWFWQEGYRDGLAGEPVMFPDETRHSFERSDYCSGHEAGQEERAALAARQALLDEPCEIWQNRVSGFLSVRRLSPWKTQH